MKKIISVVLVLMLALSLCACGGKSIVGTWKPTDAKNNPEMTFAKDGVVSLDFTAMGEGAAQLGELMKLAEITYKVIDEDTLEITTSVLEESDTAEANYSLDGDTLIFESIEYKRG